MVRLRAGLTVTATVAASLVAPLVLAAPAFADDGIGLTQGNDLLAVQPSGGLPGRLVAAGVGTENDDVIIADAAGNNPIPLAIPDPRTLALGPDGRTVWVAGKNDAIYSFSADHPAAVTTHPTGEGTCPSDVAVTSTGLVYFVAGGCSEGDGYSLRVLDPSDDAVSDPVVVGRVAASNPTLLTLDNGADAPDTLGVAEYGSWVDLLDVSGQAASEIGAIGNASANTIALAPDASSILVSAYRSGFVLDRYSVAASPVRRSSVSSSSGYSYDGLAFESSGEYFAASAFTSATSYGPGDRGALHTYSGDGSGYQLSFGRSVAWVGTTMFRMITNGLTDVVSLTGHADARQAPTTVTVTGHTPGAVGKKLTVSGTVRDRGAALANVHLTVTRTDREGTRTFESHTGPLGKFSFDDVPRDGLTNTYRISYAGNNFHRPASGSVAISVTRRATFLSIATDKSSYSYQEEVTVTAHLGGTYLSRNVAIYAQQRDHAKRRIGYGHVDSSGHLHAVFHPQLNTVYSATFFGDLRYAPVTKTLLRTTRADPQATLYDWYGTDSDGYRLYHLSQNPRVRGHVDPNKSGECVYYQLQHLVDGKWKYLESSDCFRLNSDSNTDAYLNLEYFAVVGGKYRTGIYWRGDSRNAEFGSLWRYFKVTS